MTAESMAAALLLRISCFLLLILGTAAALYVSLYLMRSKTSVAKIQNRWPSQRQVAREIFYSSIAAVQIGVADGAYSVVQAGITPPSIAVVFAHAMILVLVHDIYFYFTHRALHSRLLFRRIHALHHEFRNPTPFANFAEHPVEIFLINVVSPYAFAYLLGASEPSILIFWAWLIFTASIGHCGFDIRLPVDRLPGRPFMTPAAHDLHHQHVCVNFGLYFRTMDCLFATLRPASAASNTRLATDAESDAGTSNR